MLARGLWRDVCDEAGTHIGYQLLGGTRLERKAFPSSRASSTSISVRECQRNAGEFGASRTTGRLGKPADAIERAVEKVKQWPFPASRIDDGRGEPVFGDRAVRCYPKPAKARG